MGRAFEFRKARKMKRWAAMSKAFTRIGKDIVMAVKEGGPDPDSNSRLRAVIQNAKSVNMPKDTIEKAVKKGTGELEGQAFEDILYEGYGPGGVAIMIEALTDNRNRTAPEIKKLFERRGGSLGTSGCVNWMFKKKGLITVNRSDADEDELMDTVLSAGAEDMTTDSDIFEIICDPSGYEGLKNALEEKEITMQVAEISMIPENNVAVGDKETARKILGLMEDFEDHDDVQNVYSNFDIPDEIIAEIQ